MHHQESDTTRRLNNSPPSGFTFPVPNQDRPRQATQGSGQSTGLAGRLGPGSVRVSRVGRAAGREVLLGWK